MDTIKKVDINNLKIPTQNNLIEKANSESKFVETKVVNIEKEERNISQNKILCSAQSFNIDNFLPKVAAENYTEPNTIEKIEDAVSRAMNIFGLSTKEMEMYKKFLDKYQVIIPVEIIKEVRKTGDNTTIFVYLENGNTILINPDGTIGSIITNEAFYSFYENGGIAYISYDSGEQQGIHLSFDENGNITSGTFEDKNGNTVPIDIFGEYNNDSEQYGGSQMDFKNKVEELLQDPLIIARLKEYYPDATMEDYECYLLKICNVGCGYTALVNSLFKQYEGREKEFQEKFGFPMYDIQENGEIDFNYEYLILDYFNYIWGNSGYSIKEIYGDIGKDVQDGALQENKESNQGIATGLNDNTYPLFANFLKEKYNIDCTIDISNRHNSATENNYEDIYDKLANKNNHVILRAGGADLYESWKAEPSLMENVGSHAMYITGKAENGFDVSSWGNEYIADLSEVEENDGYIGFVTIEYEEKE